MRDDDHSFVDDAIRDLAHAVEAELEEHPDPDELLAHSRGELGPERAAWVEDHVVWCRDCASFFREDSPFDDEVDALDPEERETQWQALRRRLQETDDPGAAEPFANGRHRSAAAAPLPPGVKKESRRFPFLQAAAMLLGALGLGVWIGHVARSPGDSGAVVANPEIVDLVPPGSERTMEEETLEVADDHLAVLVLSTRLATSGGSYQARFRDATGEVVLSVDGLEPNEYGNLTLLLFAGALPPGRYSIDISEAGGGETVERFSLLVSSGAR